MRCDIQTERSEEGAEFDAGVQHESAWLGSSSGPSNREYAAAPVVIDVGCFEFAWLDWSLKELMDYWRSECKQHDS